MQIKCLFTCLPVQGSAKLEKAEILQMTVDHLKMLHASGGKGMNSHTLSYDSLLHDQVDSAYRGSKPAI